MKVNTGKARGSAELRGSINTTTDHIDCSVVCLFLNFFFSFFVQAVSKHFKKSFQKSVYFIVLVAFHVTRSYKVYFPTPASVTTHMTTCTSNRAAASFPVSLRLGVSAYGEGIPCLTVVAWC